VKLALKDREVAPDWVAELISDTQSLHEVDKFSKFGHGCAVLLGDQVRRVRDAFCCYCSSFVVAHPPTPPRPLPPFSLLPSPASPPPPPPGPFPPLLDRRYLHPSIHHALSGDRPRARGGSSNCCGCGSRLDTSHHASNYYGKRLIDAADLFPPSCGELRWCQWDA
jgi:hypothetical protein